MYNVFLSGGGLKGAYQYGFFKELYKKCPDFPIKKVYAVSVGAMNSVPIITRKIDALDIFWNEPASHPFDTIMHDWIDKKPVNRVKSLFRHGSVFRMINRAPYDHFVKTLDDHDMQLVADKLVIISFDKVNKKTILSHCKTADELFNAIQTSTLYPGLFDATGASHIDGIFAKTDDLIQTINDEEWLVLDLQNKIKNKIEQTNNNCIVFTPTISSIPVLNDVSSILSNRCMINHLIENGQEDARLFLEWRQVEL